MLTRTKTELRTLPVRFELEALAPIALGEYKGSAFRGALGHALKQISCFARQSCRERCTHPSSCPYGYLFETPPPADSLRMRKYPTVPHPFVLVPPLEARTHYTIGDSFGFELTLIGKGTDYLPYFIYAFERQSSLGIGKGRGTYAVKAVFSESGELLYNGETLMREPVDRSIRRSAIDFASSGGEEKALTLEIITPLRLKFQESLGVKPEFHVLIRNLLRRVSNLLYFHEGVEADWDFRGLIEAASRVQLVSDETRWYDWERYSSRQDARMALGGFVGKASYSGKIGPFMDLLRLGSVVHAGKGTSFGLGKYAILYAGGMR